MSNTKCSVCNEDITGAFLTVDGEVFHNECFKCGGCGNALGTAFKVRDGKKLCDSCEPDVICALCNKAITGSILKNGDKSYHAECFKCEVCAEKLDSSEFFRKDGQVMCKSCAEPKKSDPEKKELPKVCRYCEESITSGTVKLGNGQDAFHENCFVCEDCTEPLGTTFTFDEKANKYRCSACERIRQQEIRLKDKVVEEPTAPADPSNALTPKSGLAHASPPSPRNGATLPSPPTELGKGAGFNPPARVGNVNTCCVRLTIVSAKGLRAADLCGKSDPYCIARVPETKIMVQTKTKMMNLNPEWNQTFLLDNCTLDGTLLEFTLMDYDFGRTHDVLGHTELRADKLVDGKFEGDLEILYKETLEGATEICGTLKVKVSLEK